jgi:hypothetical protein
MMAHARIAELEADALEGKTLPVESSVAIVAKIVAELRARITAMPGKFATRFVAIGTTGEAQLLLEKACNELLTALRTAGRDVRDRAVQRGRL